MDEDPLLELEMRRRIYQIVEQYPGLHVRELARQLDTSVALVEYHLPFLFQSNMLEQERDGNTVRLYHQGHGEKLPRRDRRRLTLLRARLPLHVVLFLMEHDGPARHGAIAEALEISKSKLSFHLRKLEAAGIVEKTPQGFQVLDPDHLTDLLVRYEPTRDLKEEFADLWGSFYGGFST